MACIGMRLDVFPSIMVISLIPRLSVGGEKEERGATEIHFFSLPTKSLGMRLMIPRAVRHMYTKFGDSVPYMQRNATYNLQMNTSLESHSQLLHLFSFCISVAPLSPFQPQLTQSEYSRKDGQPACLVTFFQPYSISQLRYVHSVLSNLHTLK